jgi:hypothetical protein
MAMMAITTKSSMRVKPFFVPFFFGFIVIAQKQSDLLL